jgi:hypothetical protein
MTQTDDGFLNIEDLVSNALPIDGEHRFTITDITARVSPAKKTPGGKVAYRVDDATNAEGEPYTGNVDWWFSEGGMKIVGRQLFNLGVRSNIQGGMRLPKYKLGEDDPQTFADRVVELLSPLKNKQYRGKFVKKTDDRGVDQTEITFLGTASGEAMSFGYDAAAAV